MLRKDKYLILIIIVFIVLTLCSFILFITLWNNINLNQQAVISNVIYLYIFLIFASGVFLFLTYIFQISEIHVDHSSLEESDSSNKSEPLNAPQSDLESILAPYDIDIDYLASYIIPKINFSESVEDYAERILQNLAREFEIVQGVFYLKNEKTAEFNAVSTYAWTVDRPPAPFVAGEGLNGQVAKNKTIVNVDHIPQNYIIVSGLGSGSPSNLLIVPLLLNKETIGIIEVASFRKFDSQTEWTFKNLAKIIANSMVTKLKTHQDKK